MRVLLPIYEGVDEPHGIVGVDIIVHRLRQQQKLRTFEAGYVSHARFYRDACGNGIRSAGVFTRSANFYDKKLALKSQGFFVA